MSNAMTRTRSGDRFYNPPPMRRLQHQLLLQKQLQRSFVSDKRIDSAEAETRVDSDDSTLCMSNSVSASPTVNSNLTNLDRLMESVTPVVPAQYLAEARLRGQRTGDSDIQPFFCLGDLWESFKEWSVYGAGVPFLLNGKDTVKQYYVPSLSGIQLYLDPSRLRRHGEDSDAESSRETNSAGSSDCEAEMRGKGFVDGVWGRHNLMNLNFRGVRRITLRDKPLHCSSSDETEISSSHGLLVYEYLEQEQPHYRKPLYDKVSSLASQFPDIKIYRSCDLLPGSWVSVAWYPIYRIPTGPTLQNLDASFLTFHSLSTKAGSKNQVQFEELDGRKANSTIASSKIALPVFGLASYKLRGSILTPSGAHEWEQTNSLLQAADTWLRSLDVNLPDFQFFVSHNS
ncbi:hypothetical protein GH714_022909 [Hevea brasiliensis]|uniref:DUF789 domain-containing protein n=1 Tax=Hevea brasiliensis TaxID=3981 RepID=A0A6A6NJ16_HEVBR|nr:hypothetical protein GH714_022909 [Hevea brasiliensis]